MLFFQYVSGFFVIKLPGGCQAIVWTNAGILIIGPQGTIFSDILTAVVVHSLFCKCHAFKSVPVVYFDLLPNQINVVNVSRWCHGMETLAALPVLCAGGHHSPVHSHDNGVWRASYGNIWSYFCNILPVVTIMIILRRQQWQQIVMITLGFQWENRSIPTSQGNRGLNIHVSKGVTPVLLDVLLPGASFIKKVKL